MVAEGDVIQIRPKGGPYDGVLARVSTVMDDGRVEAEVPIPAPGGVKLVKARLGPGSFVKIGRAAFSLVETYESKAKRVRAGSVGKSSPWATKALKKPLKSGGY